jgi:hypothetical protein
LKNLKGAPPSAAAPNRQPLFQEPFMPLTFEPLSLARRDAYQQHLAACRQIASDYSFINLWGWADAYGLQWAWDHGLVWIRQNDPRPALWAPVGPWQTVDWRHIWSLVQPPGGRLIRVPEALVQIWKTVAGDRIEALEARGQWDYLYNIEEMIALAGNRYHKKKNLVRQFQRRYDAVYQALGPDSVAEALALQNDWCTWRDCESTESLTAENQAIARILADWNSLDGIRGGLLRVEGRLVAYTVAERLSPDTLLIHFEKGNPDFKGVYQAINQTFLAHNAHETIRWVNREQDLDDEGLRRAKLSYHPETFIKKFDVRLNGPETA